MDRNQTIGLCLSSVAGYVDTAGFVLLFGLFTAHVTGNFVLAGASFASHDLYNVWGRLATLPVFVAAVLLSAFVARSAKRSGRNDLQILILIEGSILFFFALAGLLAKPLMSGGPSDLLVALVGSIGVFAMGIQNGIMRVCLPSLAYTTVMTGNFTQAMVDMWEYVQSAGEARAAAQARLKRTLPPLCGFTMGAILSGLLTSTIHFWGIGLPIFLLFGLAFYLRDSKSTSSAATLP